MTGIYLFLTLAAAVLLINLAARIFTKKCVTLSDSVICYEGKQILLSQIREIIFFLPEISKTRSRPHSVTVWASKTDYFAYQPDYADKLFLMSELLQQNGYRFVFAEELAD